MGFDPGSILGSGVLGVISGFVGPIVNGVMTLKMKKEDNRHAEQMLTAESEAMREELSMHIQRDQIQSEGRIEEGRMKAMESILLEDAKPRVTSEFIEALMSGGKFLKFIAGFLAILMGCIDVWKSSVRPFLVYYLTGASTWVTWMCWKLIKAQGVTLDNKWVMEMFTQNVNTIIYLTVTAITFYFVDRRQAKNMKHLKP